MSTTGSSTVVLVCSTVQVGHEMDGGSGAKGLIAFGTCSLGSTINGCPGRTRRHAGTNPPRGGQTAGVATAPTVTGPKTSQIICSTDLVDAQGGHDVVGEDVVGAVDHQLPVDHLEHDPVVAAHRATRRRFGGA